MKKICLIFGGILAIAGNAYAVTSTVTSKDYVDTQDALKQNKIDATGANFTNGSVVETTGTDGVVTQRAIFDPETGMIWPEQHGAPVSFNDDHENDLLTAGSVMPQLLALQGTRGTVAVRGPSGFPDIERGIYDGSTTYDSSTDADKLVTASVVQNATDLPTITTSKMTCVDSPDCTLWSVSDQTVYGVCKGYGEYVSVNGDASECCSGFLNGVNRCGCKNNSDCPDGIECVQSGTYRYCNTGDAK